MHSQGWIPLEWGQSCAGGTGRAFSWHTAASRPRSSHPLKVLLSRQTCLLLVATHGETFAEKKIGSKGPGVWHAAWGGSQPATAAHARRHFQVILIREAVT